MRPDRAWVRLGPTRRLNLLVPCADAWSDEDLATGLSRTYRWGGHSCWDLPLSVAQHSLAVLAIRQRLEGTELAAGTALRELLHDADEGLLGFDCIAPLKPHLGEAYANLTGRLRAAVAERYGLLPWSNEESLLHRRADRLAAISEAHHVAGWSPDEIREEFGMVDILDEDPLQQIGLTLPPTFHPWEPWPPKLAARLFFDRLQQLNEQSWRERPLVQLAAAFSRSPDSLRRRCAEPVHGDARRDVLVRAEAPTGEAWEGVIVAGERDGSGAWLLDAAFTIFTDDECPQGQLVTVYGWSCHVERL